VAPKYGKGHMALAPCRECGLQVSTEAATCPRAIRRLTKPGAKYECQARIRAGLRSPRTAHFSGLGETRILSVPGEGYRVIGWVDAQNGFGGEVRTRYVCYAHWIGGSTWIVDSLRYPGAG